MGERGVWNRDTGRLLGGLFVLLALGILGYNLILGAKLGELRRENNQLLAGFFENAREQYPGIRLEEWMALLEASEDELPGEAALGPYGVLSGEAASLLWERRERELLAGSNLALLGLGAAVLALVYASLWRRRRTLDELTAYMQRVARGEYSLKMRENREGELSLLQNELYKVTVLLKEQAELSRRQKKALSDSVSDISHQLKTPLTSVTVLLDNLSESEHMDETTRRRFLGEITRQLSGISWLVAALLKLSRLDAGVVEFERKSFPAGELLDRVTENLEILADLRQVVLERRGDQGILLTGDLYWMGEALSNLVKNAIEHSPQGERVVLSLEENPVYVSLTVTNRGKILDPEEQKHIFERFYRGKYAGEGSTGIGLSLAKEVVERQGGYLTVDSGPEKGTRFQMRFLK